MEVSILGTEDHSEWNRFVDESPQGDVFSYSWWLEAVTKGDFKILVAREQDRIVAGIALPFHATGRVNEPYLTRTLGVLYGDNSRLSRQRRLSKERVCLHALLDRVPLDRFVQTCMSHNFTDWLPFRWRGYRQTTRYTYLIDYAGATENSLWRAIDKPCRETIKRALRNGISVEESDDIELVHRFSCLSFQRQGLTFPFPLHDLARLDDAIQQHGHRQIFRAIDLQGRIHAVYYVAYRPQSAYGLLSGGDPALRNQGGHTLIVWHVIQYFRERVSLYNFGGSDIEGIESHLKHFGGTLTPYFHIFNEKLRYPEGGIRYHGRELLHHSKEFLKAFGRRFFC